MHVKAKSKPQLYVFERQDACLIIAPELAFDVKLKRSFGSNRYIKVQLRLENIIQVMISEVRK